MADVNFSTHHLHIISQETARNLGLGFYFTGRPCSRGHLLPRRSLGGRCYGCELHYAAEKAERNRQSRADRERLSMLDAKWFVEKSTPIVLRGDAKKAGLIHYFTGRACVNAHVAMRITSGGKCSECARESDATPENRERARQQSRERYRNDHELREKTLFYGRAYREKNRERFTKWMADWRAKNPERARLARRLSQSKRRAAERSSKDAIDIRAWLDDVQMKCYWCGRNCKKKYHIDHYVPLARGGRHEIDNLVIACPRCNLTKSAKDPYEFAAQVGRLF